MSVVQHTQDFELSSGSAIPVNCTAVRSTAFSKSGVGSLAVISTSAALDCYVRIPLSGTYNDGDFITWSAWVMSPTGADGWGWNLQEWAGGFRGFASNSIGPYALDPGVWTRITGSGNVLSGWAGSTSLIIRPLGVPGAWSTTDTLYVDDVYVESGRYGPTARAWDSDCHPGGLEAIFTYDGLAINDKAAPKHDAYVLTSIDGIFDFPEVRTVEMPRTEHDGVVASDIFYGSRTITLSGRIRASNVAKARAMEYDLKSAILDNQAERTLTISSPLYTQSYTISCRGISCSFSEDPRPDGLNAKFTVVLRASDPRILGSTVRSTTIAFVANTFTTAAWSSLVNSGNWYAYPTVRIFENGGLAWSVTGPRVLWTPLQATPAGGVEYSAAALAGGAGAYREFSTWGGVQLYDAGGVSYMNLAVNKTLPYPLIIPPSLWSASKDSASFSGIGTHCTAETNDVRALISWRDTYL